MKQEEKDVEYVRASMDNIKKQTEMEDSRVAKGGGVSTDVLQSKAQRSDEGAVADFKVYLKTDRKRPKKSKIPLACYVDYVTFM